MGACQCTPLRATLENDALKAVVVGTPNTAAADEGGGIQVALHSPLPTEESSLGTSSIFVFPQMTEEVNEQWKIFNELENSDEADMMALASFFQTLCATATERESLFPPVEESLVPVGAINVDSIKVMNVGRLDSNIHNLDDYQIPSKGKITMDVALDIIDCYRRGGKLHVSSVQKILKGIYWLFKKFSNIREVRVADPEETLVVCGDLHGQFFDLLYVLDLNGPPSQSTQYLFNGDFVDRGPNSVEVILTLFALQLAAPDHVYLNRGNHEDPAVCCIFGFMKECMDKYDDMTFSMFIEVFRYLPLATVINGQVLVAHGGLFGEPGVLLEDIQNANRKDYGFSPDELEQQSQASPRSDFDSPTENHAEENREFFAQVVKDLLWSDPTPRDGTYANPRGEGVLFGPDVTEAFLKENRLRMLVRSHECVPLGFQKPYERPEQKELLCTIFSASNYSLSGNQGAFMKFSTECKEGSYEIKPLASAVPLRPPLEEVPIEEQEAKLYYTVHCFYMGDLVYQEKCLENSLQANLVSVVLKRRESLLRHFQKLDKDLRGTITVESWAESMRVVTKLGVRWELLKELLLTEECMEGGEIKYEFFLDNFQVQYGKTSSDEAASGHVFDALYANRKQLEAIWSFYDKNGDGTISREDFRAGCEAINGYLPPEEGILEIDRLLDLLDLDHSDSIEINEFFEAFRLLDMRDGFLDGKIDLQTSEYRRKAYALAQRRRMSSKLFTRGSSGSIDDSSRVGAFVRRLSSSLSPSSSPPKEQIIANSPAVA